MKFLEKIQKLPLEKRKAIFWLILIIFGIILFALWFFNVKKAISKFPKEKFIEQLNFPNFGEEFKKLPQLEGEEKLKEELQEVQEIIKKAEEQKLPEK